MDAKPAGPTLCFLRILDEPFRYTVADDAKLLLGWTFDAAVVEGKPRAGQLVDSGTVLRSVRGFAPPTSLRALKGQYRVLAPPFEAGYGYFGIALGATAPDGRIEAVILTNRLFRLPVILEHPLGVLNDIRTNAAMVFGFEARSLDDARAAARASFVLARAQNVPLVIVGQSQAGGEAQLQVATLQAEFPAAAEGFGFITLNAANAVRSITPLGLDTRRIEGVNFSKELDPMFGPHSTLSNEIGLQIYFRQDGSASLQATENNFFQAMWHPREHLLSSFNSTSLGDALRQTDLANDVSRQCRGNNDAG